MEIMIFLFGIFIGIPAVSGFKGLVKFAVGKLYGRSVTLFRYLNICWREKSGFSRIGFSPICELRMCRENESDHSVIAAYSIESAIDVFICIVYNFFMVRLWINGDADSKLLSFFLGIGTWFAVFLISGFIFLYIEVKRKSSGVGRQLAKIAGKMKNDISFDDIDVPDYKTLDGKASQSDVIFYLSYAFIKKLWDDDTTGAGEIIHSQETALKINYIDMSKEYLIAWSRAYYDLLYYYSAVCLNKSRADYFYDMLKDQLQSDMDADARRILAAYYFYVRNDIVTAEPCAFKAEEAAHNCKTRAERLIEDKLIKKLIADIHEKKKYLELSRAAL